MFQAKLPSPCIDVCKYEREGHCIGCSMTKPQKKMFKSLKKPAHRQAFLHMLVHQQRDLGKYGHWAPAYLAKCGKKGVEPPFFLQSDHKQKEPSADLEAAASHPDKPPELR